MPFAYFDKRSVRGLEPAGRRAESLLLQLDIGQTTPEQDVTKAQAYFERALAVSR
jgi:hypothetical protein